MSRAHTGVPPPTTMTFRAAASGYTSLQMYPPPTRNALPLHLSNDSLHPSLGVNFSCHSTPVRRYLTHTCRLPNPADRPSRSWPVFRTTSRRLCWRAKSTAAETCATDVALTVYTGALPSEHLLVVARELEVTAMAMGGQAFCAMVG